MTEATVTNEVVTTVVATETVKVKVPTKKEQAAAIFNQKLVERSEGLFASNRDFRAAVISTIETQLSVSLSSAATMYNTAKKEAETADASIALGRDPKKAVEVKVSTGKRGRPVGSKNKPKVDATVVVTATAEPTVVVMEAPVVQATEEVVQEQQSSEVSA
jgi:hypothetical protein